MQGTSDSIYQIAGNFHYKSVGDVLKIEVEEGQGELADTCQLVSER